MATGAARLVLHAAKFLYGLVTLLYWLAVLAVRGTILPARRKEVHDDISACQHFLWNHPSPEPVKWSHGFIDIGPINLHYVYLQHNPTNQPNPNIVFLLHGFPDSWAIWYPFLESLKTSSNGQTTGLLDQSVKENCIFVALDLPGYGGSGDPPDYTADTYLNIVALFICQMRKLLSKRFPDEEIGRVLVIGHDWGATIAYRLAAQAPQIADRFILINSMFVEHTRENVRNELLASQAMLRGWRKKPWRTRYTLLRKALHNLLPIFTQLLNSCYIFAFNLPWPIVAWLGYIGDYALVRLLHAYEYPQWPEAPAANEGSDRATSPSKFLAWANAQRVASLKARKNIYLVATSVGPSGNTPGVSSDPSHPGQEYITYDHTITARARDGGWPSKIRLYREGLGYEQWDLSLELREELEDIFLRAHLAVANGSHEKHNSSRHLRSPPPLDPALHVTPVSGGDLRCPTTVIWGLADPVLDPRLTLNGIGDYLPQHSQVVTLSNVGHGVPHEPRGIEVLSKVILWFLTGEAENLGHVLKDIGYAKIEVDK